MGVQAPRCVASASMVMLVAASVKVEKYIRVCSVMLTLAVAPESGSTLTFSSASSCARLLCGEVSTFWSSCMYSATISGSSPSDVSVNCATTMSDADSSLRPTTRAAAACATASASPMTTCDSCRCRLLAKPRRSASASTVSIVVSDGSPSSATRCTSEKLTSSACSYEALLACAALRATFSTVCSIAFKSSVST